MIGRTLSHYEIVSRLGAGGMGEVYLAWDRQLERKVALKVLPEDLSADAELLRRLRREARALAALDHPNIVTVFSVEESEGVHFLTMAYVEGQTLGECIPEGGLAADRLLEWSMELADAVAAAHEHGIIHRDLKPQNVMVDSRGRVRVLDFGLARKGAGAGGSHASALQTLTMTREGAVVGTYPYMSPEQLQGERVDARTDLFSLGVMLYEMASGVRPFHGESEAALIFAILGHEPPALEELRPEIPEGLVAVIRRCLAKSRNERYESAEALLADLRKVRTGAAVELSQATSTGGSVEEGEERAIAAGTPEGEMSASAGSAQLAGSVAASSMGRRTARSASPERAQALGWLRARWLPLAVGVGALLAVLLVLAGLPGRDSEPGANGPTIGSLAVLPLRNLSGDPDQEYFADGMTEALITDLSKIGALRVISLPSVLSYKGRTEPPQEVGKELAVDALIQGSVLREGGRVGVSLQLIEAASGDNVWAERYERDASSLIALEGEIARAVAREIAVQLTPAERDLLERERELDPAAYDAYLRGLFHRNRFNPADFEMARASFEESLQLDPDNPRAYAGLGSVWGYRMVLGVTPPLEGCPQWRQAVTTALRLDGASAEAQLGLGEIRMVCDWDWQGAEDAFRRSLELNPSYAEGHVFYSNFLASRGRFEEATVHLERALHLDPLNHFHLAAKGVQLELEGRFEESVAALRRARDMAPGFGFGHLPMAHALADLGRWDEAYEEMRAHLAGVGEEHAVAALEAGFAAGGFREASRRAAAALVGSRLAASRAMNVVTLYDYAGDLDAAIESLEVAYRQRDIDMAYLGVLPFSAELRADPRFQDILGRLR